MTRADGPAVAVSSPRPLSGSDRAQPTVAESPPHRRIGLATLLTLLLVALAGLRLACGIPIATSITDFALDTETERGGRWIRVLADSTAARTMVVTIEHADLPTAISAADELASALANDPEVLRVRHRVEAGISERLYELYFARRFRFIGIEPELDVPRRFAPERLAEDAATLVRELGRPGGAALKRIAPEDPWLLFPSRMQELARMRDGPVDLYDDHFVVGEHHAVVFVTTHHSPMSGPHQAPLERALAEHIAVLEARHGVVIERSALHRFAVEAEAQIRGDIARLSMLSTIGVAILLLLAYRSLRALLLVLVPMGAGVVMATAVTATAFGQIHAMTLAFGTTLVGVCVDYPIHLFSHHMGVGGSSPATSLRRVWPALVLGAATTAVGFAALGFASLPGIREIGVFAAIGILTALVTTRTLVTPLLPQRIPLGWRMATLDRLWGNAARSSRVLGVTAGVLLCIGAAGLLRTRWSDDPAALQEIPAALAAEDARVRARVAPTEVGRIIPATAPDLEGALQIHERALTRLRAAGLADHVRSCTPALWSAALQERSLSAVRADGELGPRTRAAFAAAGIRSEGLIDPSLALASDPGPLTAEHLAAAGLEAWIEPFVVRDEAGVSVLGFLAGDLDSAAIDAAIDPIAGMTRFEQRELLSETTRTHREATIPVLIAGVGAIATVLLLRYRSCRRMAAAVIPAVGACAATLGLYGWLGQPLHLLHLAAGLLILSMGVDYGVFVSESEGEPRGRAAALVGIALACTTTVLSFGLLGTAANPAMTALGLTTAIGVLLSAVATPIAARLVQGDR